MGNYSLQVQFNPADLNVVKMTGLGLTLAKLIPASINSSASAQSSLYVTWLVFQPGQENVVEWDDKYSIYGSTTLPLENGTVIYRTSQMDFPSHGGACYS